jgi:ribosomal protein L21E
MLLHWATQHLENLLPAHLKARIKEPRVDPNYEMTDPIPYFNGKTGEIIGKIPTDVITRVSRKKMRRFLTEGEDLNIHVPDKLLLTKLQ